MNPATKSFVLPALTVDLLQQSGLLVDNLFATLWRELGMKTLLNRAGFTKRSGAGIDEVVYTLCLWLWLQKASIGMFARECLQGMGKDVLYDTMNREDLNWRSYHRQVACKAVQGFQSSSRKAFVVDDSVVQRFGKKMPGVSSHFDHSTGRHVMGQQVLTLGLSCDAGFVPLDSELFSSQAQVQAPPQPFRDGRSTVAKRYRAAQQQTKPEMLGDMVRRALRAGIEADYLLGDAWFGSRATVRLCQETDLTAVLRMKKGNLQYQLSESHRDGGVTQTLLDVKTIYQRCVRKQWQTLPGQTYQTRIVDVELNLADDPKQNPAQWLKVRLLYVRGAVEETKKTAGKHDWAVFLCTDTALSANDILELYAMRWAIEVYFKEAKQHLGLLKEQSNHYAAYLASIHLTAIRFCLLVIAKQSDGAGSVAEVRQRLCANSTDIHFAGKLWEVFRLIISGALDEWKATLGDVVSEVMATIDAYIHSFFTQVLQLDPKTLRLEALDDGVD